MAHQPVAGLTESPAKLLAAEESGSRANTPDLLRSIGDRGERSTRRPAQSEASDQLVQTVVMAMEREVRSLRADLQSASSRVEEFERLISILKTPVTAGPSGCSSQASLAPVQAARPTAELYLSGTVQDSAQANGRGAAQGDYGSTGALAVDAGVQSQQDMLEGGKAGKNGLGMESDGLGLAPTTPLASGQSNEPQHQVDNHAGVETEKEGGSEDRMSGVAVALQTPRHEDASDQHQHHQERPERPRSSQQPVPLTIIGQTEEAPSSPAGPDSQANTGSSESQDVCALCGGPLPPHPVTYYCHRLCSVRCRDIRRNMNSSGRSKRKVTQDGDRVEGDSPSKRYKGYRKLRTVINCWAAIPDEALTPRKTGRKSDYLGYLEQWLKEGGDERHSDDGKKLELFRVLSTVPRTKEEDKVRKSLKQRLRELVFDEQPTEDQSQEGDDAEVMEGDEALGNPTELGDHQDHTMVVEPDIVVEDGERTRERDKARERPIEVHGV